MASGPVPIKLRWQTAAWLLLGSGLLVHAYSYRFFADDAFIALRYSQSLLVRGELTYNPGERVEGFTSPLWVLLVALFGLLGGSLVHWAQLVGAACGLGTLYGAAQLWRRLAPEHPSWGGFVVAALLSASPSFAAWTLGGLEAPLFTLGLVATLVSLEDARRQAVSLRAWAYCGACAALASLARPEGMLLVALAGGIMLLVARHHRRPQLVLAFAAPVAVLLGGYMAFRLAYYGYPLPNTFYVKTSGGSGLSARGARYVAAMAGDFGIGFCGLLVVALAWPVAAFRRWSACLFDAQSALALNLFVRGLLVIFVAYIARVGGDFLSLYRFAVPLLPLAFSIVLATGFSAWAWLRPRAAAWKPATWAAVAVLAVLCLDFAHHQVWMGATASGVRWVPRPLAASKQLSGVESVRFTRLASRQWTALGNAIKDVALPTDTLADGAAGATPFASGLPNLDLYGLNDSWVAHHGQVIGTRPGHQRWAGESYIQKKRPTFLILTNNTEGAKRAPQPHEYWSKHGYVTAITQVDKRRHGAAKSFYAELLVRKDRARQLENTQGWAFSELD